jgi:hypothetical protein
MRILLIVTAVLEAATGVALATSPSLTVSLLIGSPLDARAGLVIGRLAGAALLALGVASWLAHDDDKSRAARGVVSAMVLYNLGAVVILGLAGVRSESVGVGLWLAVVLHVAMTAWCVASLLEDQRRGRAEL